MNVVDPILHQSRWQPMVLALCAPGATVTTLTYGQLEHVIANVVRKAQGHGIGRGHLVALFIHDRMLHAVLVLALMKLGAVPVSALEATLPAELPIAASIADDSYPDAAARGMLKADVSWLKGDTTRADLDRLPQVSTSDTCRIVLTSGTTGQQKAVELSHKMVSFRLTRFAYLADGGFSNRSRMLVDLGIGTVGGFQWFMCTLCRGGTFFMAGRTAAETLRMAAAYRVEVIYSAPQTLAKYAEFIEREAPGYAPFAYAMCAGSILTSALTKRIWGRLAAQVVSTYGSTETGTATTVDARMASDIEGAVGHVIPGMKVEIVGPGGTVLAPGREGRVRLSGEAAVKGYYNDAETTRAKFDAHGFYPGDLGHMAPSGILVLTGREAGVINILGEKVTPERIEAAVAAFPGVSDTAVRLVKSAIGDDLTCAIVWRGPENLAGLKEHLRMTLPPHFVPQTFETVTSIPRNASGKIERR